MTEHNTSGGLTEGEREALRGLGQGQVPAVVERILADRLAVVQAERDDLLAVIQPVLDANKTLLKTMARADRERESAEAENARLRAVEAVLGDYFDFDADPWEDHDAACPAPEDIWRLHRDLRAALDSPTSHTQQEAEVGARVLREAADAARDIFMSGKTLGMPTDHWLRARADAHEASWAPDGRHDDNTDDQ